MAEVALTQLGPPLAEVTWDWRYMRLLRLMTLLGVAGLGVHLARGGLWGLPLSLAGGVLAFWLLWKWPRLYFDFAPGLNLLDVPQRLGVYEAGLYLKTEKRERFVPWEQIKGFHGALARNGSATAPRYTTGRLSSALNLETEDGRIPLSAGNSEGLEEVVELIEKRLLARRPQEVADHG